MLSRGRVPEPAVAVSKFQVSNTSRLSGPENRANRVRGDVSVLSSTSPFHCCEGKTVIVEGVLGEGLTASMTWDPNVTHEELFQLMVSMSSFSSSGNQEAGIKF